MHRIIGAVVSQLLYFERSAVASCSNVVLWDVSRPPGEHQLGVPNGIRKVLPLGVPVQDEFGESFLGGKAGGRLAEVGWRVRIFAFCKSLLCVKSHSTKANNLAVAANITLWTGH